MSPIIRVLLASVLLVLLAAAPSIEGSSTGKQNQATTGCTCHSNGANGITANHNFPTSYTPGSVYSITIDATGGTQAFVGGFSLQVDKGSFSNAGTLVQFAGLSATHSGSGALSWTMDWTAPSSGSGSVNMALAVLQANGNSQNSGDTWDTTSATIIESITPNQPPSASNLMILPGGDTPVDEEIMFSYIFDDADGDSEVDSQIRWSKNGVVVPAYNDMQMLPATATSVGETWTVSVTPNDGKDLGATEICPDNAVIVDVDSDGDGTMDLDDAFPDDPSETTDTDSDGVGDNADVFPNDASETIDSDNDGTGDNGDAFPNDSSETMDSDMDGVGDNADVFPNDPSETTDTDSDGTGDNGDAFPSDPSETLDSDGDGVGNNADVFPQDAAETIDSDSDGTGDNGDAFPQDATETLDSDMDGVGDNADAFPQDATETLDSDMDGVGDNADVFPQDATETLDSDMDEVGDNADAFPQDANETLDSDNDTVGDNADVFPQDANETLDSDNDTVGDNADVFPQDASETMDSDMDGVGDNADAFPQDATETMDSDMDGVGDNSDVFPQDATESLDSDNDSVGDNADAFPQDATESLDSDGDGTGDNAQLIAETLAAEQAAEDDAAQKQMMTILAVVGVLLIAGVGAVLFLRKRGNEDQDVPSKEFTHQAMPTQVQPVQQTDQQPVVQQQSEFPSTSAISDSVVTNDVHHHYHQPVDQQPVAVAEPTVLRQWTDEAGYTWRAMDDGTNFWWTGTEWQKR